MIKLSRQQTSRDAFITIAEDCIRSLQKSATDEAGDVHPKNIHKMRIGLRKLRCALELFDMHEFLPKHIENDLAWLGKHLSIARNWDVLVASTFPRLFKNCPDFTELHNIYIPSALEQQAKSHLDATEVLNSERYKVLILNINNWLHGRDWQRAIPKKTDDLLNLPVCISAERLIKKQHKHQVNRGEKLVRTAPHKERKLIKKLRYSVEFFQSLYKKKKLSRFLKTLTEIQLQLGFCNDSSVARQQMEILNHGNQTIDDHLIIINRCLSQDIKHARDKSRKLVEKLAKLTLPF